MSKTETAFQTLRRDILDGALAPGAALTIASLRARYGLGWTPLREALSRLEGERLVTFAANRGYRVAAVSAAELRDLQQAREAVETALLRAAIAEGDAAWEAAVVGAHHNFIRVPALRPGMPADELQRWEQAHEAFHAALISGGSSAWLRHFSKQIADQLHRHQRHLVLSPAAIRGARDSGALQEVLRAASDVAHHTALLQACLDRDGDRACRLLVEHIGLTLAAFEATDRPNAALSPEDA